MKSFFWVFTFSTSLLLFAACSNTTPQIGMLNSISDGLTMNTSLTTSTWQNVLISGQCTNITSKITITIDTIEQDVPCTNNTFSHGLTKSDLSGLTSGSTTNVYVKAVSKMGNTNTYTVAVRYLPTLHISQEILAGSATLAGGTYKLKSRIRFQEQHLMAQGNYQLKGWVR